MKRIFYILSIMLAITLASCSNEELGENTSSGTREVTVSAAPDYAMGDGSTVPQTRGTANVDRYVIEVYQQADYTQAANVFADGTNRANNSTGTFAMILEKGKSYYCLLWADKQVNGTAVYTVTDLKNVALVAGSNPSEAFQGTKTIEGDVSTYNVSLTRAVANIVLKEKGTLAAGHTQYEVQSTHNVRRQHCCSHRNSCRTHRNNHFCSHIGFSRNSCSAKRHTYIYTCPHSKCGSHRLYIQKWLKRRIYRFWSKCFRRTTIPI